MIRHMAGYRLRSWMNGLWLIANSLLSTVTTVLLTFSTNAIFARNIRQFVMWTLIDLAVWLVYLASEYFQIVNQERLVQRILVDLRNEISDSIRFAGHADFHKKNIGQYLSNYLKDVQIAEQDGLDGFFSIIGAASAVAFDAIALLAYHYLLLLLALGLAVVMLLLPRKLRQPLTAATLHFASASESYTNRISNLLSGFDTFFGADKLSMFGRQMNKAATHYSDEDIVYVKKSQRVSTLISLISILCQIAIDVMTSILAITGQIALGVISSSGILAGNFFNSLSRISKLTVRVQAADAIYSKLAFTDTTLLSQAGQRFPWRGTIEVKDLSYAIGDNQVIDHLSFSIQQGDNGLVVGASGAGKSTLLKILSGRIRDYEGEIVVDGSDLQSLTLSEINSFSQYIDQNVYLFNDSVANNVTLWEKDPPAEKVIGAMQNAQVDFISPSDQISEGGANLSGGQSQRLAIARALYTPKPLIYFDEGTSALDRATGKKIEDYFLNDQSVTFVEVTHHLDDYDRDRFDWILDFDNASFEHRLTDR